MGTCGGGLRFRYRNCDSPSSKSGGQDCKGSTSAAEDCNSQDCGIDGKWSLWKEWNSCSQTCGEGVRFRYRKCDSPSPKSGGQDCKGNKSASEKCNSQDCGIDGGWNTWKGWTTCGGSCGIGKRFRHRACDKPAPNAGGKDCEGKNIGQEDCDTGKKCPQA